MKKATGVWVSTFGALVGLSGIEHGIGEILQGSVRPADFIFPSWPNSPFFQVLGGEPAATILPNLLVTGILAVLGSLSYLSYAIVWNNRKNSGPILILLSIILFLFGGGIFPPFLGALIGVAAIQFNTPPARWRVRLSPAMKAGLARLWPWFFGACLASWLSMVPGIPILNYYFGYRSPHFILFLIFSLFATLALSAAAGFARDIRQPEDTARPAS